jgi:hypothetical protein
VKGTSISRAKRLGVFTVAAVSALVLAIPGALGVHGGDTLVTEGSPPSPFSANKQNEPAIAVDQGELARGNPPLVLAAGANDNIDMEACNAGNDTTCPFTDNVGGSGISFSFDGGDSWTQPTYTGWSARHCTGAVGSSDPPCTAQQGPIGTLPHYDELGLVSDGDPALAFGPVPKNGSFDWSNGSRLYYANLSSNVTADFRETRKPTFKGFEAIYVSRTDDVHAAAANDESAWELPVRVSRQSSATFADKEQIWADNAETSRFFGRVYLCWADFRGGGAAPLVVATSADGGKTWAQKQVSPAHNVAPKLWGQSGCTIRTDSTGVVYVFFELFQSPFRFLPPRGTHMLVQSFDGGRSWTQPRALYRITDPCFFVDPVIFRCIEDGVAGARNDLAASPSVDIANGAPFGTDATNLIVNTWADGRDGLNNEHVMLSYSKDLGRNWVGPVPIESDPADRGYYAAPALSPDGTDLYVVYNAFTTPFRNDTASVRDLRGVVLHADVANKTPGPLAELHRSPPGDPRGSSQNNLQAEFLGDYVYAVATRDYGAAVWNDVRDAADCPAIDAWRMSLRTSDTSDDVPTPAPQQDCPPTFGNSDIFGGSYGDPS